MDDVEVRFVRVGWGWRTVIGADLLPC
jgi:hypothetical protein